MARSKPRGNPKEATAAEAPALAPLVRRGRLLAGSTPERLLVDFADNGAGPLEAITIVPFDEALIAAVIAGGRELLLTFEDEARRRPVITGVLGSNPLSTLFGALLSRSVRSLGQATSPPDRAVAEAKVDGKRVVLDGKEEVVLRCGKASITLRRDGKIVLKGGYIESDSDGVTRIKAGAVKIN